MRHYVFINYIVVYLFDSAEVLCLCVGSVLSLLYGLVFVSTPGCGNGAGRRVYICSLFCLVQ